MKTSIIKAGAARRFAHRFARRFTLLAATSILLTGALTMQSCSTVEREKDDRESVTVKADGAKVSGDLEGFLEVVPGDYVLTPTQEMFQAYQARVKLRVVKAIPASILATKEASSLSMELIDEGGSPVPGVLALKFDGWQSYDDRERLQAALAKGSGDVTATFVLEEKYGSDREAVAEALTHAKRFTVGGAFTDKEVASSSSLGSSLADASTNSAAGSTSDADWDKMLTDYEAYTTAYISAMKKAGKGDMTAVGEYMEIMTKATDLAEDMERLQGEATTAQVARFAKMQAKLTQASLEAVQGMQMPN